MPSVWRKPPAWNSLGALVLKSESDEEMLVEVSGQDEARGFLTRLVNLPAKTRSIVDDSLYSLTSIYVKNLPAARLGIHCPAFKEAHVIAPQDWGNIWVYGVEMILAGFISRGEFRQRAKMIPPNSKVFQYEHTKTKNLAVPFSTLNPLQDLFARVRAWEAQRIIDQ